MLAGLLSFSRQQFKPWVDADLHDIIEPCLCPDCGWVPLKVEIESHRGSEEFDFHGIVRAICSNCGLSFTILSILGAKLENGILKNILYPLDRELPVCSCGSSSFLTAKYEIYTGDFFEEGGLVGECSSCSLQTTFIRFD
jgi:hypothetical protein